MALIKITNCTTTTGGGKKKPLRWRQNQNVTLYTSNPNLYNKPNIEFVYNFKVYYTTKESKVIFLNIN